MNTGNKFFWLVNFIKEHGVQSDWNIWELHGMKVHLELFRGSNGGLIAKYNFYANSQELTMPCWMDDLNPPEITPIGGSIHSVNRMVVKYEEYKEAVEVFTF